jgi:MYXO-CTERM domain-containing protein
LNGRRDRWTSKRHYLSVGLRTASIVLASFLVPSVAWADSEDPCTSADYVQPSLHSSNRPLVRDGWIALELEDLGGSIGSVRLRDASGREVGATQVFDDRTGREHEIFKPAEVLEPGDYELAFRHDPECFESREITLAVHVGEQLAEPAMEPPVITSIHAVLWDESSVEFDVEVETPHDDAPTAWMMVEGDYVESWPHETLIAPKAYELVSFHHGVEGQEVTEVCARAKFYDLAGTPSETTEFCTSDFERREIAQSGPLGCRVGGGGSPGWALGVLLGVVVIRRRRGRRSGTEGRSS